MNKKVLANLEKCYSIAPLHYKNTDHILVAAEKTDRCILFDINGNEEETVWEGPGGVMTMVQVPGTDGQFLATHKFQRSKDYHRYTKGWRMGNPHSDRSAVCTQI